MRYLRSFRADAVAVAALVAVLVVGVVSLSAAAQPAPPGRGSLAAQSVQPVAPAASSAAASAAPIVKTRKSWNPHVSCLATVTSLRVLLGSDRNQYGGATYRGGGFKPGIPDKRAFHPPCHVNGHPTFVQVNGVEVGSCAKINEDGDWTCNLTDPSTPLSRPLDMKSMHIETDRSFRLHSGWSKPPGGELIKVQGFVYWDPGHTTASWHHFSGWELHSFTAWRRPLTTAAAMSSGVTMRSCDPIA